MISFNNWCDFRDCVHEAVAKSIERGQINLAYLDKELELIYRNTQEGKGGTDGK